MLCDSCSERDAVVHLTTIENNAVHQLHLCEKCAAERGVETTVATPKHPLGEFLHDGASAGRVRDVGGQRALHASATRRWRIFARPAAGAARAATRTSRREFASCCDACTGITGTWAASYRPPMSETLERAAVLGELKERLRRAIESEQFELAADLRDRIRVME